MKGAAAELQPSPSGIRPETEEHCQLGTHVHVVHKHVVHDFATAMMTSH